jgi:hypothetical protein
MLHYRPSEPFGKTQIFRVCPDGRDRFAVRNDDDELLGTSGDETKAIWSAVLAADLMSEQGYRVRVLVKRGGSFSEEYVARPKARPAPDIQ